MDIQYLWTTVTIENEFPGTAIKRKDNIEVIKKKGEI